MVEKCQIGNQLTISRVLTGLWQIADIERKDGVLDPDEAAQMMGPYVEACLTTFDMADHYGSAELIAGAYNSSAPGKTQLLTKWVPKPGELTRDEVRDAVKRAIDRLKTDSVDLLQYHAWNYADATYLDQLFWLQELKEEGLLKNLGLTNFDTAHLRVVKTSGIDVATNQICYSLLDQRGAVKMAATCEELDIKILAFGTLAGGFLSEKWIGKQEPEWSQIDNWSLMKYKRFIDVSGGWTQYQKLLVNLEKVALKHQVRKRQAACIGHHCNRCAAMLNQVEHLNNVWVGCSA